MFLAPQRWVAGTPTSGPTMTDDTALTDRGRLHIHLREARRMTDSRITVTSRFGRQRFSTWWYVEQDVTENS